LTSRPAIGALERKPIVRRRLWLPVVKRTVILPPSVAFAPLSAPRSDGVTTSTS
jgi:hypothetical protein